MALQEIKGYKTPDGWMTVDTGITAEEWLTLLEDRSVIKEVSLMWLLRFYREPNHQSSCTRLGKKYKANPQSVNAHMTNCARAIQKYLNRFTIVSDNDDNDHFVNILVNGKSSGSSKDGYLFEICPELSKAIEAYLYRNLFSEFKSRVLPIGLGQEGINELYKWQIVADCESKNEDQILNRLVGTNLIDNMFDGAAIKKLLVSDNAELCHCFSLLRGPRADLQTRYDQFKIELDCLTRDRWKYQISDERMAGAFLACADPANYTFYKYEVYMALCRYLGIEPRPTRQKIGHFYDIISDIFLKAQADNELVDFFSKETSGFSDNPLLAAQTIAWYMQDYMNSQVVIHDQFTWVPFVREFAEKLYEYKSNRQELLSIFYGQDRSLTGAYQEDGEDIDDITPFTILGTLAIGTSERRRKFAAYYKEKFSLKSAIPSDYTGMPSMHPQKAMFIYGSNKKAHTQCFWDLFEAVLKGNDIAESFDETMKVKGVDRNLTMGLFWISPERFFSLDKTNEYYLVHRYGFRKLPNKTGKTAEYYTSLMETIRQKMEADEIKEKSYLEFSAAAYEYNNTDENENDMDNTYYAEITNALRDKKNIILQGAPGTGKTYAIPEVVVRLCGESVDLSNREEVMTAFKRLTAEKRVVFTTFHQSMDYEDFVEGLKPEVDENDTIRYIVQDGIFKSLCLEAAKPVIRNNDINLNPDASIWKVSLQGTYDNDVRSECLENGHIRIGWDTYGENYEEQSSYDYGGRNVLEAFYNKMNEGDIVLSCYTNKLIDAIGVVEGAAEWHDEYSEYKRLRKVRWLVKGIREDIYAIIGKTLTLSTVYRLNDMKISDVLEVLKKHSAAGTTVSEKNEKPYVIVIDEINRGNVSKIFGELITLLEADKRIDGDMPLTVKLPYSKAEFCIPSNLYLIGTMNTADRSLSQFDYAMRRRFRFITMTYGLVEMQLAPGKTFQQELFDKVTRLFISNYDQYLENVNTRLIPAECFSPEFKPVDLWIGPSFFITDDDNPDSLFNNICYEIIPTLEHYLEDGVFVDEAPVQNVIDELMQIALAE